MTWFCKGPLAGDLISTAAHNLRKPDNAPSTLAVQTKPSYDTQRESIEFNRKESIFWLTRRGKIVDLAMFIVDFMFNLLF